MGILGLMCAVGNVLFYVLFALRPYRGRDHPDGGRRKDGDHEEHYSGRDDLNKRKRSDS